MFEITIWRGNRHLTVSVPRYVDRVVVEFPPEGQDEATKPLIVLASK